MNVDITCLSCDREFGPDSEDGWTFTDVPWNSTTMKLVAAHKSRYGHHVKVVGK